MIFVTKSDLPDLNDYVECLKKIWESGHLTNNGPFAQLLEKELEKYLGVKHLSLVSNGTLAIQLALKALDISGDVLTTPFTFAATTNTIIWEGLNPIFVDVDPDTYNIDPTKIESKITDKTTAILAVHVYGNPCHVEEIQTIADKYNLKVIYDAAHAFDVEYMDKQILNYGDISTLSFHATKIFNTIEGGAVIMEDDALHEKIKLLRSFGIKSDENIVLPGINAKMNEFQAAMGLCNLKNLGQRINSRKTIYEHYKKNLNSKVKFQKIIASKYNYPYMPVCFDSLEQRDSISAELLKNNVKARKYFYPLTSDFDYFKTKDQTLVNATNISNKVLCLPLYSSLNMEDVDNIINIINKAL